MPRPREGVPPPDLESSLSRATSCGSTEEQVAPTRTWSEGVWDLESDDQSVAFFPRS